MYRFSVKVACMAQTNSVFHFSSFKIRSWSFSSVTFAMDINTLPTMIGVVLFGYTSHIFLPNLEGNMKASLKVEVTPIYVLNSYVYSKIRALSRSTITRQSYVYRRSPSDPALVLFVHGSGDCLLGFACLLGSRQ